MASNKFVSSKELISTLEHITPKTYLIKTLGCRANQAETSVFAGLLKSQGWKYTATSPGLVWINTCAITGKGEKESFRLIKQLRIKYPKAVIAATGCAATLSNQDTNGADYCIDNINKEQLISKLKSSYSRHIGTEMASSGRLLVRIQNGCNHFCSYCIVPYLRNELSSVSPKGVIQIIEKAEKKGFQEVILTGTNLELYGQSHNYSLDVLIAEILKNTAIPRIGFGSINYGCFTDEFVKLYSDDWKREEGRLNRYFHIPLQSGSDSVLKRMNRPYTTKQFSGLVNKLIAAVPNLGIGTDIIVGFPGETEQEFNETVSFIKNNPFSRLHIFRYSPRPKTKSAQGVTPGRKVPEEVSAKRARILGKIGRDKANAFRESFAGKEMTVMLLKKVNSGIWRGLTDNYLNVTIKAEDCQRGKLVEIRI